MKITDQARAVAACGGYSEDNYKDWAEVAQYLLNCGYSMVQVEAIMRSKWTRWAADMSDNAYGQNTSVDLSNFMLTVKNLSAGVDELVAMTPSEL